ncbi:MAG: hypothetical protein IPK26_28470 [Planctomycetes bacterium]|nr:hypothetical protein [Planctomycetota bacterium]
MALSDGANAQNLVIHLWVDPIYGDDGQVNAFFNPDATSTGPECSPSQAGPHAVVNSTGQPLLNVPYPFKTISAAVQYINRQLLGPGRTQPLPATGPASFTWSHAIIHLLPGWYMPATGSAQAATNYLLDSRTGTHLDNRLVPNGEQFPIRLPPRVSLQGTSALNTVISTGGIGSAIEFGVFDEGFTPGVNDMPINGVDTFIDSVTFYMCGGQMPGGAPDPDPKNCAAILFDDQVSSRPTVTNCVFVQNVFGILVNNGSGGTPLVHDGAVVMNCSFVWNETGIWNGQLSLFGGPGNRGTCTGLGRISLLNCLFDTQMPVGDDPNDTACSNSNAPRTWPFGNGIVPGPGLTPMSAFEGISEVDMLVSPGGVSRNTNAFEFDVAGNFQIHNLGTAERLSTFATNRPSTQPRSGPSGFTAPSNLGLFTGFPPNNSNPVPIVQRGILYVRDLLCRGRSQASPAFPATSAFDGSPLDFRLSPFARRSMRFAPGTPEPQENNPLVDTGQAYSGPWPAEMANDIDVATPGALPGTGWTFDSLVFDCEGFGNPRIYARYGPTALIDVGADELGHLVVGGMRMGTTTFLNLGNQGGQQHPDIPTSQDSIDNRYLIVLGRPSSLDAIHQTYPFYRTVPEFGPFPTGDFFPYPATYDTGAPLRAWHSAENVAGSPSRPGFRTRDQTVMSRRQPTPLSLPPSPGPTLPDFLNQLGEGYRATTADVTPALLPDIHPWWNPVGSVLAASGISIDRTPPHMFTWQPCSTNPWVPFLGVPIGADPFAFVPPLTSRINPPGSGTGLSFGPLTTAPNFRWLDNSISIVPAQIAIFGEWAWPDNAALADFDAWGRAEAMNGTVNERWMRLRSTVDTAHGPEPFQIRFSIEWSPTTQTGLGEFTNLQSFDIVVHEQ